MLTNTTTSGLQDLPVMAELDDTPTMEELSKAIDALASGKASGKNGIPPEVIKAGKSILFPHLHELLCQCWEEGTMPQDIRDATVISLYKNKGNCSDGSYRGISLLSIVGKAFAKVVVKRLQVLSDCLPRVPVWLQSSALDS